MTTEFSDLSFASLFSGAGIGDIGLRAAGLSATAMCEIEPERSALGALNFPEGDHFAEDIAGVAHSFIRTVRQRIAHSGGELFLLSCTAPCQGMSKGGKGTLLKNIRDGNRPALDPRNGLILPALDIIVELQPLWVVFENVSEMRNTLIVNRDGQLKPILEIIRERLGKLYEGEAYDVEFADYGIPQRRQRLITVFSRDPSAKERFREGYPFIPRPTHAARETPSRKRWVSVTEALSRFEPLDGSNTATARSCIVPFHYVPVLDPKKYEWIRHTKAGKSAFDNQCVNPECLSQENPVHGSSSVGGINQASKETPLYCGKCGSLLPRPFTEVSGGGKRIMSGFTSAYKRMSPDLPSPTLTRNLSYPCSDSKVHPLQNRVLSLAEAMTLQTISRFDYKWGPVSLKNKRLATAPDSLIRLVIGESVPPFFMQLLGQHLQSVSSDNALREELGKRSESQLPLLIFG